MKCMVLVGACSSDENCVIFLFVCFFPAFCNQWTLSVSKVLILKSLNNICVRLNREGRMFLLGGGGSCPPHTHTPQSLTDLIDISVAVVLWVRFKRLPTKIKKKRWNPSNLNFLECSIDRKKTRAGTQKYFIFFNRKCCTKMLFNIAPEILLFFFVCFRLNAAMTYRGLTITYLFYVLFTLILVPPRPPSSSRVLA